MINRRRDVRRHLYQYFDTFDIEGNFIGKLADISVSGIQLVTDTEIPQDTSMQLDVRFPCEISTKALNLTAKNVWCSKTSDDSYLSGFSLLDATTNDVQTIKETF